VSDGENTANYQNPEFDALFARLKTLDDGPAKQEVIDKHGEILQDDAPWSMGFYPWASAGRAGLGAQLQAASWCVTTAATCAGRAGAGAAKQPTGTGPSGGRWRWCARGGALVGYTRRSLRMRERTNARGEVLAA
jgi:hypothetical protein